MVTRLRSTWLAGGGAVLLVLSLSGIVAGATLVGDGSGDTVQPADPPVAVTDTTLTFEDVDGNGIDDDCQDPAAVADLLAAPVALAAADLNGDGTISVSEAAQSGWTGGTNCNHGGYVSGVARGSDDGCAAGGTTPTTENTGAGEDAGEGDETSSSSTETAPTGTCDKADDGADEAAPTTAECPATQPAPAPAADAPVDTSPNAHGTAVSKVAQSDAVGGKNCNHGGAVSEAAKKDHSGPHGKAATKTHGKGKGHGKN